MLKNVELRKLPVGCLFKIIDILEINDDWKKLMAEIPKDPLNEKFEPKYNYEHMRLIEDSSKFCGRKCAEILLDEWSTSGKIRPTLETLKLVAIKAGIYRAADEIAVMLDEELPTRPKDGPAAAIDYNISDLLKSDVSIKEKVDVISSLANEYFNKTTCKLRTSSVTTNYGEQTTAQMKQAINPKFSKNFDSSELPQVSGLQFTNKSTAQIKSESDLIKFSNKEVIPEIVVNEPSLDSINIPRLSLLIPSEGYLESKVQESDSRTTYETDINSYNTESESEPYQCSKGYQISIPNISLVNISSIDSSILQDTNLTHFEYSQLEELTSNFSDKLVTTGNGLSGFIGSGGFGEVFVGVHNKYGPLAIKKAHHFHINHKPEIALKVFNNEVKYLSQFRHNNIVPIIGYSADGPALCVVCEYIAGGSLEQKLVEKVLTEKQRIEIMMGTAEGLKYLHRSDKPVEELFTLSSGSSSPNSNSKKNNFIHGDVKSANILLTSNYVPKLCDFGLAKQFETTFLTTSPMGTSAYMAPEGFSGTITQKIDIYSYGIVLLELLTGLKPIININNETINIKEYIQENSVADNIEKLLDAVVGKWMKASEIYRLALQCLEYQRKKRPSIEDVCDILYEISRTLNNYI